MQIPAFRSDFLPYTSAMLIRQSVLFFGTAVWRVLIISALLLVPREHFEMSERMGVYISFIILADAHCSHDTPCNSVPNVPFACCP